MDGSKYFICFVKICWLINVKFKKLHIILLNKFLRCKILEMGEFVNAE